MAPIRRPNRRPPVRSAIRATPHPSIGCGHAYAHHFRTAALSMFVNNTERNNPDIALLRQQRQWASLRTLRRWRRRLQQYGHLRRFQRQGNVRATVLRGRALFMLAYYRMLFPKARAAEINVWMFGATGRFYSPDQISRAEDLLGLSTKRGSTTARQANHPRNQQIRYNYWNLPYPFGMVGIRRDDIIDIDECGVFVESTNRGRGKAVLCRRVREEGAYSRSQKLNVLMAISGESIANGGGQRWVDTWTEGGTTIAKFIDFMQTILNYTGPGTPQRRRCFTMDNLNSHTNHIVRQMIHMAGHRVVFRAPYHPVDGPIEYVFNTLQQGLTAALYRVHDMGDLRREVSTIIANMDDFEAYFVHCGFRFN